MASCEFVSKALHLFTKVLLDGVRYSRLRRAAQEGLTRRTAKTYQPMQEREASFLIRNLLREPTAWQSEMKR
jgi:cytochrome P450